MTVSTAGTTKNDTSKPGLGPSELLPKADGPFLLSKSEFIAVQTYVEAGTRLPSSNEEMQLKLGITKEDVGEFSDLVAAYKNVNDHCAYFKSAIFPMSVGLASDIVAYNTKVPTYYGALKTLILQWQAGTISDEIAKKKFQLILGNLRDQAKGYADTAAVVKQKMIDFTEETKADQSILDPIKKRYKEKYEGEGGEVETFRKQVEEDLKLIKTWNDEYNHDVTVAATSATYAWIWPIGTIAAAIVAGIYGKKATDALDHVHEYQQKKATAEEGLRRALNLMHDLELADTSLDGILTALAAALPVLQKMEGIWGAISDDLNNIISQILDKDIGQADLLIKDLGVDEAIIAWEKVSRIADNYRANAYISIKTEEEIKQAA